MMESPEQDSPTILAKSRMSAAVAHVRKEFSGVRSGRASVNLLDSVQVEAYDSLLPLNQVASLTVPEPTLIVATPFDPTLIGPIEKGIQGANLGLNPSNDGKAIRIPIPMLTEERRREMSRLVHRLAEEGRTALRQIRRDANDTLKKLAKSHEISEDDERRSLEEVQGVTDSHVKQIDILQETKDKELLQK